jgi:hypothetical protein
MPLTVAEFKSESGPASNNFTSRTLTFDVAASAGVRVAVLVDLYTSTGAQATAGMISDSGGHTWTQDVGQTGDGSTGGVAILSTLTTTTLSSVTLTPVGSGNYATWGIARLSGNADLDDAEVGSNFSTAPQPTTAMVATTTDGVALSVISTRSQGGNQTQPSGWTAIELEPDNSSNLAGAIAHSPNISSAGSVGAIWTIVTGSQWFFTGVIYKAASGGGGSAFIPAPYWRRTILRRQR